MLEDFTLLFCLADSEFLLDSDLLERKEFLELIVDSLKLCCTGLEVIDQLRANLSSAFRASIGVI